MVFKPYILGQYHQKQFPENKIIPYIYWNTKHYMASWVFIIIDSGSIAWQCQAITWNNTYLLPTIEWIVSK